MLADGLQAAFAREVRHSMQQLNSNANRNM